MFAARWQKASIVGLEQFLGGVAQEARYAETVLSHTRIVAPMDGIVIQRLVETGATVVPGTPIFKLVDPATVWVTARIDESVVGRLAPGLPAQIRLRTGETVPGQVARIAQQSDAATREITFKVAGLNQSQVIEAVRPYVEEILDARLCCD